MDGSLQNWLPSPGDVLNYRYRIDRLVGKGSLSVVYEATMLPARGPAAPSTEGENQGTKLAVKLLRPEVFGRRQTKMRARHRIDLSRRLSHPNVTRVLDRGRTENGLDFYATELIQGVSLRQLIEQDGGLTELTVAPIAEQILMALGHAHEAGVLHCDLKPENIFITKAFGLPLVVKVTDFELTRAFWPDEPQGQQGLADIVRVNSPAYCAYEVVNNLPVIDGRCDIYSLGMVMHELLTGRSMFVEDLPESIARKQAAPRSLEIDANLLRTGALGEIIRKAIHKDPNHRFQSAKEMLDGLREGAESVGPEVTPSAEASTPEVVAVQPGRQPGSPVYLSALHQVRTQHLQRFADRFIPDPQWGHVTVPVELTADGSIVEPEGGTLVDGPKPVNKQIVIASILLLIASLLLFAMVLIRMT